MFNRVILIGRLTADPELRYTPSGSAVCNFSVAVQRKYNREEVDFINIAVWGKMGEVCAQYLTKGRLVGLEGRLRIDNYTDKNGNKRKGASVITDDIKFLDRPKNKQDKIDEYEENWESLIKEIDSKDVDRIREVDEEIYDEIPF